MVYHRLVWVGRELKAHLDQHRCSEQGYLQPEQGVQSPRVQPGLERSQGWGVQNSAPVSRRHLKMWELKQRLTGVFKAQFKAVQLFFGW